MEPSLGGGSCWFLFNLTFMESWTARMAGKYHEWTAVFKRPARPSDVRHVTDHVASFWAESDGEVEESVRANFFRIVSRLH